MKRIEELKELIPKHSLDNYHIEDLMELSDDELLLISNDLLKWLRNMHFAVAKEVAIVFSTRHNAIKNILKSHLDNLELDTIWKYNIIAYVIGEFNNEDINYYNISLTRITDKPTKAELYSEVNDIAKTVLNKTK